MMNELSSTIDYNLDRDNETLLRDGQEIQLRPKLYAVLRYLIEHPNRLLTHRELLSEVWSGVYVSPEIIKSYVRDLRKLLDDDARAPRFIETKHGRGYRFIGKIEVLTRRQESRLRSDSVVRSRHYF